MARMYFDPETQQMVTEEFIVRRYHEEHATTRFGWVKFFPHSLDRFRAAVSNSRFDVVAYLFDNTNIATNEFARTPSKVASDTGVSAATVVRVFTRLQEYDVIRPIQRGLWMLNPAVFYTGHEVRERMLLQKYTGLTRRHVENRGDKDADPSAIVQKVEDLVKGDDELDF